MFSSDSSLSSLHIAGTKGCRDCSLFSCAEALPLTDEVDDLGSITLGYARERVAPCQWSSACWIPTGIDN